MAAIRDGKSAIPLSQVRRDRERGTVQLIRQEEMAAWEPSRVRAHRLRQPDAPLADQQLLTGE